MDHPDAARVNRLPSRHLSPDPPPTAFRTPKRDPKPPNTASTMCGEPQAKAVRPRRGAYRQASADLAPVINGVVVDSVLVAPTGDLVVFFHRPDGSRYAWVYDPPACPTDKVQQVEYARLSLLGDLVPPAHWVRTPARKDLAPWTPQFGDVLWAGKIDQPKLPTG